MAALDFPNAPTNGQQFSAPNGAVYTWDGAAWTVSGVLSTGTAAGGDLSGTYPNPTVAKSSATPFTVPGDANSAMALLGSGTPKGRVQVLPSGATGFFANRNWFNNAQDDATKPSWGASVSLTADNFVVQRSPAGSTTQTTLFTVNGADGKTTCTLADQSVTRPMLSLGAAWQVANAAMFLANQGFATANQWTLVGSVVLNGTRGGTVLITANPGLNVLPPTTGNVRVWLQLFRDGSPSGGGVPLLVSALSGTYTGAPNPLCMIVPGTFAWDTPPAGNHTYALYVYFTAGILTTQADNTGTIWAMELS